jgi:Na+/proline symporter
MFTPVSWKDGEETILPLGAGFAIILGFGVFFSLLISAMTFIETRATGKVITSEQFNTAGHSLKTGLTGAAIVSQWTWAATLLQSSNVAWQYGISGPFWYAAGASIQVLLFGILAIEIKQKAPTAHTFLEFVYRRWGKTAHIVMLCYAVLTNTIVSAMLLLGGAAVTNALTGMDTALASFLIPWGVILYTMTGGLKATIMAQYLNTIVRGRAGDGSGSAWPTITRRIDAYTRALDSLPPPPRLHRSSW